LFLPGSPYRSDKLLRATASVPIEPNPSELARFSKALAMTTVSDEDYYEKHAAMLGKVSLAWNDVHSMVFAIFADLTGMSWERAEAIFFSLKADQAQRDITLAVMADVLSTENDLPLKELGTALLGQIGSLAGERNVATHAMWVTLLPTRTVIVHPDLKRPKLLKEDFRTQFENLTTKLRKLFRELLLFRNAVRVHLKLPAPTR
jgi:hypothetical protein